MNLRAQLDDHGFAIAARVVPDDQLPAIRRVFEYTLAGHPGRRDGLDHRDIRELAASAALCALVTPVLGASAFAYRATLFDKTRAANWLVAWHQDLVVPVRDRVDAPGYGPWSHKRGIWYVQPPAEVLAGIAAVRVDLDGSTPDNGALRVLPGSHRHGVLAPARIAGFSRDVSSVTCVVPPGGALLMRPLLLHASSRAGTVGHRRIVHLEFAACELPGGPAFRDAVGAARAIEGSDDRTWDETGTSSQRR